MSKTQNRLVCQVICPGPRLRETPDETVLMAGPWPFTLFFLWERSGGRFFFKDLM